MLGREEAGRLLKYLVCRVKKSGLHPMDYGKRLKDERR